METDQILQGDTLTELKKLPDNLIDTIVTSPPYWGLRDYGIKGQIGLESTLEEYIHRLLTITRELKRVLKPTGVMFWNHGDCYGGSWQDYGSRNGGQRQKNTKSFPRKDNPSKEIPPIARMTPKCLALQNYRLILRMIDSQGWILRNIIQWHKPNSMPSSVKDRFTNSYEPVFMLVKQQRYWFDLDAVRKPHTDIQDFERHAPFNYRVREAKKGHNGIIGVKSHQEEMAKYDRKGIKVPGQTSQGIHRKRHSGYFGESGECLVDPRGKNPGDLWTIPTQPFPKAHFATFPEKLIEPMILAACPEWICKKCGKARVRITEIPTPPDEMYTNTRNPNTKLVGSMSKGGKKGSGQKMQNWREQNPSKTLGWTDCKCGAGFKPGIALDPFMGAGTVGVVAKSLGRQYLGIELSPDYIKIAEKRLLNTMGRLF